MRAILETVREVADQIIVAADLRSGDSALREYALIADQLFVFEFREPIERVFPWLHAQCSGDWILRLDTDEVPSVELVSSLPSLIEADDVVQYWIPRHWLFPDVGHWLFEWPWWPDFQNRLVRNDGLLWMPGLSQTMNEPELPARYLEAPLYHLDTAVRGEPQRQAKLERYLAVDPALRERVGDRLLDAYYLPERHADSVPVDVRDEDRRVIAAVLEAPAVARQRSSVPARRVSSTEIDRHWPPRAIGIEDYRALVTPVDSYREFVAGEHRPFRVAVRNDGGDTWPGGESRQPLIRVGYRWKGVTEPEAVVDTPRGAFPGPVPPGAESIVPLPIVSPAEPGEYTLEIDVVHEFVRWFGSAIQIKMTVRSPSELESGHQGELREHPSAILPRQESGIQPEGDASRAITPVDGFNWMFAGFVTPFHVRIRNISADWWPGSDEEFPVRLGYRWHRADGQEVETTELHTSLPAALAPGSQQLLPMRVHAPKDPGEYILELDVVHEFVRWLGVGSEVPISVRPAAMAPQAPPREGLPPSLASMDPQFADRLARLCGLGRDDALRLFEPGRQHEVTVPSLGGCSATLRGGTSDLRVLDVVFDGAYHLPPVDVPPPHVIVDLGANIGLTMAHYASLFPAARILGVELDAENVELCRRNIAPWGSRCTVVHAAIWPEDTELVYARQEGDEWAYRIGDDPHGTSVQVRAMSLATLFGTYLPDLEVDFLKIDIEGAERDLLRGPTDWASRVRSLKVETHEPYTPTQCAADLARLGFSSKLTGEHFDTSVAAYRTEEGATATVEPSERHKKAAALRVERDQAVQDNRVLRGKVEAQRQRIEALEQGLREADEVIAALQNMKVVRWSAPLRRIVYRLRARRG